MKLDWLKERWFDGNLPGDAYLNESQADIVSRIEEIGNIGVLEMRETSRITPEKDDRISSIKMATTVPKELCTPEELRRLFGRKLHAYMPERGAIVDMPDSYVLRFNAGESPEKVGDETRDIRRMVYLQVTPDDFS